MLLSDAPDFTLPDQDGEDVTLSVLKGRPVVLRLTESGLIDEYEYVRGDLGNAVRQLKQDPGRGLRGKPSMWRRPTS
ncbi:MAG: redoxin domain-containing protein [Solirubrobacterales bacterium]|nr:redoxin domain-containing protein [Solirubrobacterales bacterium]